MKLVGSRVDAVTLAYRVALEEGFVRALKSAGARAKEHGRAAFQWESIVGELRYSRDEKSWFVCSPRFRMRVLFAAPGGVEIEGQPSEPGWTIEIMWNAQALAVMSPSHVRIRSRAIAKQCGRLYQSRLRRIDLCTDVAGWQVDRDEIDRFVRRPNTGVSQYPFDDREVRRMAEDAASARGAEVVGDPELAVVHYRREVTGFTFCPGGELLCRVYDKPAELRFKREDLRRDEFARWRRNGWDGIEPVTRVEFQIRGTALHEFGLRDPDHAIEWERGADGKPRVGGTFKGFENVIDRVWRACVAWLRLVKKGEEAIDPETGKAKRASRRVLDPKWAELFRARFVRETREAHGRVRVRGGATIEMALGCNVSVCAVAGELRNVLRDPMPGVDVDELALVAQLRREVLAVYRRSGELSADGLAKKWGPRKAIEHVREIVTAGWARFTDLDAMSAGGAFAAA